MSSVVDMCEMWAVDEFEKKEEKSMATINLTLENMTEVGENIRVVKQDKYLILVIDTTVDLGLSSTGKMRAIGNSSGFTALPGGLKGNIYIGKKA